jgi:glyoxylase-like metal-dependent hydrolase (beta-lactamase superfamily II)
MEVSGVGAQARADNESNAVTYFPVGRTSSSGAPAGDSGPTELRHLNREMLYSGGLVSKDDLRTIDTKEPIKMQIFKNIGKNGRKVSNHWEFSAATAFRLLFALIWAAGTTSWSDGITNQFTSVAVADHVTLIQDGNAYMYLVEGQEKALLIDTGNPGGDLKSFVEKLTALPLIVVNTHGHRDHTGHNPQFDRVFAPAKDIAIIRNTNNLVPIEEGYVFDLGGRTLEVIEVPGHTPGGICLLDAANKLLFAGDTIVSTPVWLHLPHSLSVATYVQSLQKLEQRSGEFSQIFAGHAKRPLDHSWLEELITCGQKIVSGEAEKSSVTAGQSDARTYRLGKVAIICKGL